jgi:hypothetical protein
MTTTKITEITTLINETEEYLEKLVGEYVVTF